MRFGGRITLALPTARMPGGAFVSLLPALFSSLSFAALLCTGDSASASVRPWVEEPGERSTIVEASDVRDDGVGVPSKI